MKKGNKIRLLSIVLVFVLVISGVNTQANPEPIDYDLRLEFLEMLCEVAKVKPLIYEGTFSDVASGDKYAGIIAGALNAGIIDTSFADEEGSFKPYQYIHKDEAVAMMVKTLIAMKNDLGVGETLLFSDKADIDDKYLTYIEVACANGIIENNTGKFFEPWEKRISNGKLMAESVYEHYKRLPVLKGSGIMRVQFPVIETDIKAPEFLKDGYKMVFQDEFDGDSLDTTKWGYNYSWGNSHNHAAWCAPENVIVNDGILTLKGENKQHPDAVGKQGTFNNKKYDIVYTSGAVNTHHKYNFTYGYFEARLKMPKGKGMWPAWWMLKDGWPPEIDMLEILCSRPNELHVNYHYGPAWNEHYSHEQVLDVGFDASEDFHTYGFEWTPEYMKYYVDGVMVGHAFTNKSAIKEADGMYMILNLAIDGWDGKPDDTTRWPAEYQCDYVRVWQIDE